MVKRALLLLFFVTPALLSSNTLAQAVARADRSTILLGDTLNLVIEVADANLKLRPNLTPLKSDFEVIGRPRTESRVSIVNGKTSSVVRFVVTLAPLRAGITTVPAIAIGQYKTNPVEIEVKSSGADAEGQAFADIIVEASAMPSDPYLQSEVIYRVRLLHVEDLLGGSLSEPKITDAVVQRIGDDVSGQENRHGRTYQVIERRYAIFPQASGTLSVPAPVFVGEVAEKNPQERGLSKDGSFGLDPFGGFFQMTRRVHARGPELTLSVRPVPESSAGQAWLPARSVKLSESWSAKPIEFRVGEPATRTIQLKAVGLTAPQLPTIALGDTPSLKLYPDQPTTKTVTEGEHTVAYLEQKVAIVPTDSGVFTLPEIVVHWWDTVEDRPREAVVAGRDITVVRSAAEVTPERETPLPTQAEIAPLGSSSPVSSKYRWATPALLALWVLTVTAWIFEKHRRVTAAKVSQAESPSIRLSRKALRKACETGDASAAGEALLNWAHAYWLVDPPLSMMSIATRFASPQARQAVETLDQHRYGCAAAPWDGAQCWVDLREALSRPVEETRGATHKTAALPALYS